jgi:hypothetical protein
MTILAFPGYVATDGNGTPYAGAKLYFYQTGTTTNQNTYSDSALSSANTNPVVADANGLFGPIYLDPTLTYKAVLKTSADVTIWTRDPLGGPSGSVIRTVITGSTTHTKQANTVKLDLETLGGGGGGGGAVVAATAGQAAAGGGGGAGSYSRRLVTAATFGASAVTVTIGAAGSGGSAGNNAGTAGGDTSIGALCIGKGGSAGAGNAGASLNGSNGGAGGVAGTGDLTGTGMDGQSAVTYTHVHFPRGGSTYLGSGGAAPQNGSGKSDGGAGTGYGSGGGGGVAPNGTSNASGGAGRAGIAIITEYLG